MQTSDVVEFKEQLSKTLGWDETVVEGIVQVINDAKDDEEIDQIVQNFMGGNAAARELVRDFRRSRTKSLASARKPRPSNVQRASDKAAPVERPSRPPTAAAAAPLQEYQHQGPAGTRYGGSVHARVAKPGSGKRGRGNRQGKADPKAPAAQGEQQIVRFVVNCLGCGKIYDCHKDTADVRSFVEAHGKCTFCGRMVPSLYGRATDEPPATEALGQPEGEGKTDEAEAAALDLKDRLVEYDRNSAARTSVIDDQSDYFAIDSNIWLDETERRALAARQAALEEAEARRSNRITVAVDLMGRQVLLDEDPEHEGSAPPDGPGGLGFSSAGDRLRAKASEAADATAVEIPQGGGSAVTNSAVQDARAMRIPANPDLRGGPAPLFLPRDAKQGGAKAVPGAQPTGGAAAKGRHRRQKGAAARLQHDNPFDSMAADLLEELPPAAVVAGAAPPFDICQAAPPIPAAPASKTPAAGRATPAGGGAPRRVALREGLVLLRGFLSLQDQSAIVRSVRELGVGPGGFYTPSYAGGGELKLRMMCLGKHWEPRTAQYEDTRSSFDGATPPPIPEEFLSLVGQAMSAARDVQGVGLLPDVAPDICLCNFYEKSGTLGLHQDRDESQASLRRGTPVVSFSIGDAAEFLYSTNRNEATADVVRLESGDVLIFGGKSRMLFHGIRSIFPSTAPNDLILSTSLRPGRLNLTFRQFL